MLLTQVPALHRARPSALPPYPSVLCAPLGHYSPGIWLPPPVCMGPYCPPQSVTLYGTSGALSPTPQSVQGLISPLGKPQPFSLYEALLDPRGTERPPPVSP